MCCVLEYLAHILLWGHKVLILSLLSLIRLTLFGFVALSLGMGLDAPWGRVIAHRYVLNTKGLFNVKKDICGRSPPGRNARCRC